MPLSGVAFQFYNADLLDICIPEHGEDTVAFMDDTLTLVWGKTLDESNQKVGHMMEKSQGGLDLSHTHQCNFAIDKFGVMGLTRQRE